MRNLKELYMSIDIKNFEKPSRFIVLLVFYFILIFLLFFNLWLFDEKTTFNSDYYVEHYLYGEQIVWSWFHKGVVIISTLLEIAGIITIVLEYTEPKKNKPFKKLYE